MPLESQARIPDLLGARAEYADSFEKAATQRKAGGDERS